MMGSLENERKTGAVAVRGHVGARRCLSCGTDENMHRRRYCSADCRQRLRQKLDLRTGLIQALNARYATFSFSDTEIALEMLLYGVQEIFGFFYPRSPGKKPAEDFSTMADLLGRSWWEEIQRSRKRHLATHEVLRQATRIGLPASAVRPPTFWRPNVREASLAQLNLSRLDLDSLELAQRVKAAYRLQAKRVHPDTGGQAEDFRKIHEAYQELLHWAAFPTYLRRRGFPDKWLYDGESRRWIQPLSPLSPSR